MEIKEIRAASGLSRAAFAAKYGIPVRSMENWESGKSKCPAYLTELLQRVVAEDNMSLNLDAYNPYVLKELGSIYRELLFVLNKTGHNPYPNADIFPIKYFNIVFLKAVTQHIPESLDERIRLLLNSIDQEEWVNNMDTPCPADMRQYFTVAMLGYE